MTSFAKSVITFAIALFLICGIAVAQQQQQPQPDKPKAAVYIKGNPQGRDVLRMAVNTFLIKTGMYRMVAVDAIDLLAQEHIRQQSGSVSDNEIASLGRDAGAQYVCVVERTEIDGVSYVTTSMVSVQSKIAEFSDMKELPRGERVISVIERQINAMLGIGSGEEEAGYEAGSEPESSESESESVERQRPVVSVEQPPRSNESSAYSKTKAVDAAPFNPSAVYLFSGMSTIDSRGNDGTERSGNRWLGGLGFDAHGKVETRNTFGMGLFLGGGTYGDGVSSFFWGVEVKNLFWLVKGHLAVPMSIGIDMQTLYSKMEMRTAAGFIDAMSASDRTSDAKMDMYLNKWDLRPTVGLQVFITRKVSICAGYAYNLNIFPLNWDVYYKVSGKSYASDDKGDKFDVPQGHSPLQGMKESFLGAPGALRVSLNIHVL